MLFRSKKDEVLEVVEIERFISKKNAALFFYYMVHNPLQIIEEIKLYFEQKYGVIEYDNVVFNSVKDGAERLFPAKNYIHIQHHLAHAYSGFYQSPFESALIISFDGGSDEGFFNVYIGNKNIGIHKIYSGTRDYAVPYMLLAHHISDIKHEELHWGNLVYAGKLMGYAAYGNVTSEYIDKFTELYNSGDGGDINKSYDTFLKIFGTSHETRFINDEAKNLEIGRAHV